MSEITEVVKESRIVLNVIGVLIILALGIAAGILFDRGIVSWALVVLLGGGFVGMIFAWSRR